MTPGSFQNSSSLSMILLEFPISVATGTNKLFIFLSNNPPNLINEMIFKYYSRAHDMKNLSENFNSRLHFYESLGFII